MKTLTCRTHAARFVVVAVSLLIAACGGDATYKRFPLTQPQWKNFDESTSENGSAYVTATTDDAAGNSWRAFNDAQQGRGLRKVNNQGVEIWRTELDDLISRMAAAHDGVVAISSGNNITFFNDTGAVAWQASVLDSSNVLQDVKVGSDGRILLAAYLSSANKKARVMALNSDGSVRWDHSFSANTESLSDLVLLENDSGQTVLVEQYYTNPGIGVAIRTIDAAGNLGPRNTADISAGGSQHKQWYRDGHIVLQQTSALYRLSQDGNLQWHYAPPALIYNTFHCAQLDEIRYACAYQTKEMETVVDWLDESGAVVFSKTFALDEPVDMLSDGQGRLILVEKRWPVFSGGDEDTYYIFGLLPSKFGTYRLHQLDDGGAVVQTINLLSGRAIPPFPPAWQPRLSTSGEYYSHAQLTPTHLIVSARLEDFGGEMIRDRSFVSAYPLE